MVVYTTALGDLEVGEQQKTVVFLEKKSSPRWLWKASGLFLLVALCLGGVLCFTLYWSGRPEMTKESGQKVELTENDAAKKTEFGNLRQVGSKAKAAIHLEGYDDDDSLEWRSAQGQGFSQGGFRMENNKIVIPDSGLYFVYSQASFRVTCREDDGPNSPLTPLSHKVWRYSDSIGSDSSLMSAIRSVCQGGAPEEGRGRYSAIYLGAVFKLNKGDQLWTETNHIPQLETEEGKTFFGVFKL
ncbi:tumor necrosis factor b (TNF superfamily, member 2) [Betta splendens]|uniref:Lymphotoxin-alpha n=1 Tax=Betta splendens TaxID=158456 RepID=A0A6P7KTX6_BETSP|nr:tumor necrosis factor b (TNF superfamily, member 2) [Betta splendens]